MTHTYHLIMQRCFLLMLIGLLFALQIVPNIVMCCGQDTCPLISRSVGQVDSVQMCCAKHEIPPQESCCSIYVDQHQWTADSAQLHCVFPAERVVIMATFQCPKLAPPVSEIPNHFVWPPPLHAPKGAILGTHTTRLLI